MYLYSASQSSGSSLNSSTFKPTQRLPQSTLSRTVGRELVNSSLVREKMKDTTSSKLNIKGPKQAAALEYKTVRELRQQLSAFSDNFNETLRANYFLDLNTNNKNLQIFQCSIFVKLQTVLRNQMVERGDDFRKYKIGGFDGGTYERFFKVEPSRYMSKAQLLTALRMIFGGELIKSASVINRLFDSFDLRRRDEMDWRSFLYLLVVMMMPVKTCFEIVMIGYSLYSSVGTLDTDKMDPLPLGVIKDLICTPVQLSLRSFVHQSFDNAWIELQNNDSSVLQYAGKQQKAMANSTSTSNENNDGPNPDDLKITFQIFLKILQNTSFSVFFDIADPYGKRDPRRWTSVLEAEYYHPILVTRIKELRRELRNEDETVQFIEQKNRRIKRFSYQQWKVFVNKRTFLRFVLIGFYLRSSLLFYGQYFDHWRRKTMEVVSSIHIQRVIRGFLIRRRTKFIKRFKKKVNLLQSSTRQYLTQQKFFKYRNRLYYAANVIQRVYRGRLARRRVSSLIEAYFDTEMRKLEFQQQEWIRKRRLRATVAIQMVIRAFLVRKRVRERVRQRELQEAVEEEMKEAQEKQRVEEEVFKQKLSQWYLQRKIEYNENVLTEKRTKDQKKIILERRRKIEEDKRILKQNLREQQLQRLEEERVERWLKDWEIKIQTRAEAKRKQCQNCLVLPETPEDVILKKELQKRIKIHIKEVLKSADKQKIPMEIPEAYEIATKEMIEEEVLRCIEQSKLEQTEEANKLQEDERIKKLQQEEKEKAERQRKAVWANITLQKYIRQFLAKKRLRQKAYERYEKQFDPTYHEYFYLDKITKTSSWEKPKSLGEFDLDMDPHWIILYPKINPSERHYYENDNPEDQYSSNMPLFSTYGGDQLTPSSSCFMYYYNPATWEQRWDQPLGTLLCDICHIQFGKIYYPYDHPFVYCDSCFQNHRIPELFNYYYLTKKDINVKLFEGGKEDSSGLNFWDLPDVNWYAHSTDINPALKYTEEEEEQEELRRTLAKTTRQMKRSLSRQTSMSNTAIPSNKRKNSFLGSILKSFSNSDLNAKNPNVANQNPNAIYCDKCQSEPAKYYCKSCHKCKNYCAKCSRKEHRKERKKAHILHQLASENYDFTSTPSNKSSLRTFTNYFNNNNKTQTAETESEDSPQKGKKKKKKKGKNSRRNSSGSSNPSDTDATEDSSIKSQSESESAMTKMRRRSMELMMNTGNSMLSPLSSARRLSFSGNLENSINNTSDSPVKDKKKKKKGKKKKSSNKSESESGYSSAQSSPEKKSNSKLTSKKEILPAVSSRPITPQENNNPSRKNSLTSVPLELPRITKGLSGLNLSSNTSSRPSSALAEPKNENNTEYPVGFLPKINSAHFNGENQRDDQVSPPKEKKKKKSSTATGGDYSSLSEGSPIKEKRHKKKKKNKADDTLLSEPDYESTAGENTDNEKNDSQIKKKKAKKAKLDSSLVSESEGEGSYSKNSNEKKKKKNSKTKKNKESDLNFDANQLPSESEVQNSDSIDKEKKKKKKKKKKNIFDVNSQMESSISLSGEDKPFSDNEIGD